jgi:serine/threonine protein kinase
MLDYRCNRIGDFHGREIGRGGSSQVKLVRDQTTGKQIAVKYFSGPNLDRVSFIREVEALAALNHPCVLRILNFASRKAPRCAEIHTEYAERGSLEDVLTQIRRRSAREFWTPTRMGIVICDMVLAMRFVHVRQIIHRDLKPSNVLIRGNGRALIGDFGSSRFQNDDSTWTTRSGTVHYAAPELFEDSTELTPKVDVWGFGLILYEIVSGLAVFPFSLSPFDVIRQMRRRYRPIIPVECGEYMGGLISRCWSDNPCLRPSFNDILLEFQARGFRILPDVDCDEIRAAVGGVLMWEFHAGVAHP